MSTFDERSNRPSIGTSGSDKERHPCPRCQRPSPMNFVYPGHKDDLCEENNVWRFQRCCVCGWTGDVVSGERLAFYGRRVIAISRDTLVWWELRDYLKELQLCE